MKTLTTNVCIIGAGPAGTTTSIFLSKFRIPHIIVDAAEFPRDKVCGDALDLRAIRILNHIEPGFVKNEICQNENFSKSYGVIINISEKKKARLSPDSPYPFLCMSKRKYFDNFLLSKIDTEYATLMTGTKVEKIDFSEKEKTVFAKNAQGSIVIKAKMIVGADGDHSVVLRELGQREINRSHYAGGLRQYWKGISGVSENFVELYLPKSLPLAYLWIFPLPGGEANVGCGLLSSLIAKESVDLKKLFDDIIKKDPVMSARFKNAAPLEKPAGWGIPLASLKRKAFGDGWLLTGDAASLVCPTTGEGIGPAMRSGYIAAHFINSAIEKNDFSENTFRNYEREIYKDLEREIRMFERIKKRPGFYNFFIKAASRNSIFRWYFKRTSPKWIRTAYEGTPVKVNID